MVLFATLPQLSTWGVAPYHKSQEPSGLRNASMIAPAELTTDITVVPGPNLLPNTDVELMETCLTLPNPAGTPQPCACQAPLAKRMSCFMTPAEVTSRICEEPSGRPAMLASTIF